MIIDIDKIPQEGLTVNREFEFQSHELVEETAAFLKPVHADLTVRNIAEEVWIKGRVTARLSVTLSLPGGGLLAIPQVWQYVRKMIVLVGKG